MGTVSASAVAANGNRKFLRLQNMGTGDVHIRLGTAVAVSNEGIRLAAGGSYEMSFGAGNVYSGAITGIAAFASTPLSYIEGE